MSWPICPAERRVVGEPKDGRRIVGQHEVAAVVAAMDDRLDVRAAHLGRRVDVRDEADRRHARLGSSSPVSSPSRSRARRSAGVGEPDRAQLLDEIAQQDELLRRARIGGRALVGLRVVPDVAEEALEDVMVMDDSAWARRARRPRGRSSSPGVFVMSSRCYANVAMTGAWSLVPTSFCTGHAVARVGERRAGEDVVEPPADVALPHVAPRAATR